MKAKIGRPDFIALAGAETFWRWLCYKMLSPIGGYTSTAGGVQHSIHRSGEEKNADRIFGSGADESTGANFEVL